MSDARTKHTAYLIVFKEFKNDPPQPPRLVKALSYEDGPVVFHTEEAARKRFIELKASNPRSARFAAIHKVQIEFIEEMEDSSILELDTTA